MRGYFIDELDDAELDRLRIRLKSAGLESPVQDLFWLPVPPDLLTPAQQAHRDSCGPHCLALELGPNSARLELLVRAKGRMRCECLVFASPALRGRMIEYLESLLEQGPFSE